MLISAIALKNSKNHDKKPSIDNLYNQLHLTKKPKNISIQNRWDAIEKIILFGDSLMAGYGLQQEKHLATVLQKNLDKCGYKIDVINGSVSGSTYAGGLTRVVWSLSQPDIDLMILGFGFNDMLRGIEPSETEENLEKIIQTAKEKNIEIILAGMIAKTTYGISYKKCLMKFIQV